MVNLSVKSPNTDDVFAKFIEKTPAASLEKKFAVKGVKFEKGNISAAESVKDFTKSAVFFFSAEFSAEKAEKFSEENVVDLKKLSKITFYEFPKKMEEWKGEEKVPMFKSIAGTNCKSCAGKGYTDCKKCEGTGFIKCKKCEGSGLMDCKECKGTGKLSIDVEVINGDTNKKEKRAFNYQCGTCLGTGKITCKECGGMANSLCPDCKPNLGKIFCKDCDGVGKNYKYNIESVPLKVSKQQYMPHLFFRPELEKKMGEELISVIDTVDGIYIKNADDLNEKFVKAQLGYWDGDIKNRMNNAKNEFKNLQKAKGAETPKLPIYVFPLLRLEIKTPKGKTFDIFSIGTDKGYEVFAPNF